MSRFSLPLALLAAVFLSVPGFAEVKITKTGDTVQVAIDGKPFTALMFGQFKPFLFPLRAASGASVTRSYPLEKVEGESTDHPHQVGLWFNHGLVNGLDLWNASAEAVERAGAPSRAAPPKYGKIELNRLGELVSGDKTGSISAVFDWMDLNGNKMVTENRKMTFYSHPTLRIVDLDIQLTPAAGPVVFGDIKEGTLGTRLSEPFTEKGGGTMVNAEGLQGESQVWGKRSAWVDFSSEIHGEKLGIAIFDHPGNLVYPTYWHARGYGLFAANPFGERDFTRDRSRDGSKTLEPGQTWRFRYRVVIHPGDAAAAGIAKLYEEYKKQ